MAKLELKIKDEEILKKLRGTRFGHFQTPVSSINGILLEVCIAHKNKPVERFQRRKQN